jgi:hypothetical protein
VVTYGEILRNWNRYRIRSVPRIVPSQRASRLLDRGTRVLFLRVNNRLVRDMSRWPARYASVQGSMCGAQRVRQVWYSV